MKYRFKDWMPELINKFKCQYHSKSSYDEAYDEVVRMRNPLPLPMDECSSQELFEELIQLPWVTKTEFVLTMLISTR